METAVLERKARTSRVNPFFITPTVNKQGEILTYEKIGQLKALQDTLIAEGRMEKPQIIKGFSTEDRKDFELGIRLEDYAKLI